MLLFPNQLQELGEVVLRRVAIAASRPSFPESPPYTYN